MPLADTSRAIGSVTEALKERLDARTGVTVSVGRLDQSSGAGEHLNLFLYEVMFDPHLKNTPLNESEKPPVWIVLKYLLTAFENSRDSDSPKAHEILGSAIRAIYQDDLLKLDGLVADTVPLAPNPSELYVTFDESPSDLVAKLTQGTDETPRLSVAFQVRPVMIASGEPGDYSLLVGVDYTKPPVALADPYVGIDVFASMGSRIEEISPTGFELGEEVAILGTEMDLANLSVMLGSVELPVTMQQPDQLKFKVDNAIIESGGISAGSYPVTVVQTLPGTGKKRKSNAVIGNFVPSLNAATIEPGSLTVIPGAPPAPATAFATINLDGVMLGADEDDTILAFYRNGKVQKMFDVFASPSPAPLAGPPPPPPQPQPTRQLVMAASDAVPVGDYSMILIVNGQQSPQSPLVHLDSP